MTSAGISLFNSEDGYLVFVSLLPAGGSNIGTAKAVTSLSSLLDTLKALLHQWQEAKVKAYLVSVPSAFPADEYYDVLNAITEGKAAYYYDPCESDSDESESTIAEGSPSLLITHGEAFCATLSHDTTTPTILFLDFYPNRVSSEYLLSAFDEGERQTKRIYTLTSFLVQGITDEAALKTVITTDPKYPLERIVLNNPPSQQLQLIRTFLETHYPGIPFVVNTPDVISASSAARLFTKLNLPRQPWRLAQYIVPVPVSVASATGGAITLVPPPVQDSN